MTHRFLFSVFSEAGKLNPFLSVARELERAGHEIIFWSPQADVTPRVKAAGMRAEVVFEARADTGIASPVNQSVQLIERMKNTRFSQRWFRSVLVDSAPAQTEQLRSVVRAKRPSAVVADPMCYAGPLAATLEKVPWIGLSPGFYQLVDPDEPLQINEIARGISTSRDALFMQAGAAPQFRGLEAISPWLNLVFTTEEFVPRSVSKNVEAFHVGAAFPTDGTLGGPAPFPWERLPKDVPIIYVAFGSYVNPSLDKLNAIVASLGPGEAFFVVALKDLMDDAAFVASLPPNALGVRFAPQLEVLDHATVAITHGGLSSVMESIGHGVPVVVVPLVNDHPPVAAAVESSGAGVRLEPDAISKERCREILLALISDPKYRERAKAMAPSLLGGAGRAAELISALAESRRPLHPKEAAW